jgi:hypothetical protein
VPETGCTLEFTMSILSVQVSQAPLPACQAWPFSVMEVLVASRDALLVRRALVSCAETAILRCRPINRDHRVCLEIRFPAALGAQVIERIMASLPGGEIGRIMACDGAAPRRVQTHAQGGRHHGL